VMSVYDPDDGYEPCVKCGELTQDSDRLCGLCKGLYKRPKLRSFIRGGSGYSKPRYHNPGNPTRRKYNHSFD